MSFSSLPTAIGILLTAGVVACTEPGDAAAPIGAPLPGLAADEGVRFRAGEVLFNRVFTPEQGLGPFFNENQCSACHTLPATGGSGDQLLERGSTFSALEQCDDLTAEGGTNVRSKATPLLRAHGVLRQQFPARAVERGRFTPTFLFGLGLVERIPEQAILSRADPDDSDHDGISGRPGRDAEGRLGRFGRKADAASIEDFIHGALFQEMGITTTRHAHDGDMGGTPFPAGVDPASDPELDDEAIALLADFVRFLAPPARRIPLDSTEVMLTRRGADVFERIGCARCHVPSMTTQRSTIAALDRKRVALYSDLLLHDLGTHLATVCTPGATPAEHRTALLLGLRFRRPLLHDGRALSPEEAIQLHGGEATATRARFLLLNEVDRIALLTFLASL